MEVVAVHPHVDDVEGAHCGPAVLVGEGDRREPVGLHLLGERDELVPGLRDRVAVLLPHALAVVHRPRVGVDRDEVVVPVRALRGVLEGRGKLRLERRPDVVDRGEQALRREELHPVAGEPGEDVLGLALEVGVDLLLERVVVDRVDLDVDPCLLRERLEHVRVGLLRHGIGAVRAERDGARRERPAERGRKAARGGAGGREAVRRRGAGDASEKEAPPAQSGVADLCSRRRVRRCIRHDSSLGRAFDQIRTQSLKKATGRTLA